MKNYIGPGATINFVAGAAFSSGDMVVLPECAGIAANDIANGVEGVISIEGEYQYTKVAGTAFAAGDLLNYDASADNLTKATTGAAGDVTNVGICTEAALSAATLCKVKLLPGHGTFT